VSAPRTRRIWFAETAALCERLEADGEWQTAIRVRIAAGIAVSRRPDGSAFDYRANHDEQEALSEALDAIRTGQRA
jgi:hypothetical protein